MRISQFNNFAKLINLLNLEQDSYHPSSSINNTGVITSHRYATLPGLQPVHDGNSHKREIPANQCNLSPPIIKLCMPPTPPIILPLQRETRGTLSEVHLIGGVAWNYLIYSHQSFFRWFTGRLFPTTPDQSLSHFGEKHEVSSRKCISFRGTLVNIYYSRLSRNERYHSKFHPRRK